MAYKVKDHITNISMGKYKYYLPQEMMNEESLIDILNDVPTALLPKWLVHTDPFIRMCARISYDKRVGKES